ncbi:MAG: hypothetical protein KA004_08060 [Verrucomicrobiales bacterium]|nr:hypothetical protein [Verrucomicrobiales bacterium]
MKLTSEERELAWLGDAVLSLFSRQKILQEGRGMDQERLAAMTSNQFLSCFGNPTRIEAAIGLTFQQHGLDSAFAKIEADLLPVFGRQWKNRGRKS